jgi:hypothetical protein
VSITYAQILGQGTKLRPSSGPDIAITNEAEKQVIVPMKSKYLDLRTGEVISAKQLLAFEKGKSKIWKSADELYLLLADIADAKEEQAHSLICEVETIRALLEKYQSAEDSIGN